ncbi:hypothetical protein [Paraburkholderia aspalathi]|uniref:hypothetical protein n=1 Tax=Paraburkholderia aspalathi TaxID=1324617 RepID=UPI0038BC6DE1
MLDVLRDMAWQVLWDVARQMLEVLFPQYRQLQDLSREVSALYAANGTRQEKLALLAGAIRAHAASLPLQSGQYNLRHYLLAMTELLGQLGDQWAFIQVSVDHVQGETTAPGKLVAILTVADHWLERREVAAVMPASTREELRQLVRPMQTLLTQVHLLLTRPHGAGWLDILTLPVGQAVLPEAVRELLALGQQLSGLQGIRPYPEGQPVVHRLAWLVEALSDETTLRTLEPLWGKDVTDHLRRMLVAGKQVLGFPVDAGLGAQAAWLLESLTQIPGIGQTSAAALLEGLRNTLGDDSTSRALFDTLLKLREPDASWWSLVPVIGRELVWPLGRSAGISVVASWVRGQAPPWARPVVLRVCEFYESISPDESWSVVAKRLAGFVWDALPEFVMGQFTAHTHDAATLRHAKMMVGHASWEETLRHLVHEARTDDPTLKQFYNQYLNACLGWQIYRVLRSGDRTQTQARLQQLATTLGEAQIVAQFPYLDRLVDLIPMIPALYEAGDVVRDIRGAGSARSWLEWGDALVDELSTRGDPALRSLHRTLSGQLSQWVTTALMSGIRALARPAPGAPTRELWGAVVLPGGGGLPRPQAGEGAGRLVRKFLSLDEPDDGGEADAWEPVPTTSDHPVMDGRQFAAYEAVEADVADAAWAQFVLGEDEASDGETDWRRIAGYGAGVWAALGLLATAVAIWRAAWELGEAGLPDPMAESPASGRGLQQAGEEPEDRTLLSPPADSPYRDTTERLAQTSRSSWQRYRMSLVTATLGVAVPATLLFYLRSSGGNSSPALLDEEIDAIVADVIAGASGHEGRMKREAARNFRPRRFITSLLRQIPGLSYRERSRIRGTLIVTIRRLALAYRRKQNHYPDASAVLVMLDEALDKLITPDLLSQPERAAGFVTLHKLVKAGRAKGPASPDANLSSQAQSLMPITASLVSTGQPYLTSSVDKVAEVLLARYRPDPAPQFVRMQDSATSLPWTDALSDMFRQFRVGCYSPDIPLRMKLDIELYRNRTEDMVDEERWELERSALKQRYAAAYPTPLDFDAWASGILQRELDQAHLSLTPESKVQVSIYEINTPDPDSVRKSHELKERISARLLDVAMGRLQERYPGFFLEISIAPPMKARFTMETRYVPTTFAITDLIEKEIRAGLGKHLTVESISAKKQIARDAVIGAMAGILEALERGVGGGNVSQIAECKVALTDVLEGRKAAGVLRFLGMIVADVFAVPLGQAGKYLLVSTMQDKAFELDNKVAMGQERARRLSKWLMPHLSVRQQMQYGGSGSGGGFDISVTKRFQIMGTRNLFATESVATPYSVELAAPGIDGLSSRLSEGQLEQIKNNFDTALHTSDEAWAAFASENLSTLLILAGGALGLGAGAGALSLGARFAMLLGSVVINSMDAMLDAWQATLVNDDPDRRSSLIRWAALGAFLGVLGDTADAAKLLKNLGKARKLADELAQALISPEFMRGPVREPAESVKKFDNQVKDWLSSASSSGAPMQHIEFRQAYQQKIDGFDPSRIRLDAEPSLADARNRVLNTENTLTWKQRGYLARWIDDERNRISVADSLSTSVSYMKRLAPHGTSSAGVEKVVPLPQTLILAAGGGDVRGQCYELSNALAVALSSGRREKFFDNLFYAAARTEPSVQWIMENLGRLHADRFVTVNEHLGPISIRDLVKHLGEATQDGYYIIHGGNHAMMIAKKADHYHFYDPNVGYVEYADRALLERGLQNTIGTAHVARQYAARISTSGTIKYGLMGIDVKKSAQLEIKGHAGKTIASYGEDMSVSQAGSSRDTSMRLGEDTPLAATLSQAGDNYQLRSSVLLDFKPGRTNYIKEASWIDMMRYRLLAPPTMKVMGQSDPGLKAILVSKKGAKYGVTCSGVHRTLDEYASQYQRILTELESFADTVPDAERENFQNGLKAAKAAQQWRGGEGARPATNGPVKDYAVIVRQDKRNGATGQAAIYGVSLAGLYVEGGKRFYQMEAMVMDPRSQLAGLRSAAPDAYRAIQDNIYAGHDLRRDAIEGGPAAMSARALAGLGEPRDVSIRVATTDAGTDQALQRAGYRGGSSSLP